MKLYLDLFTAFLKMGFFAIGGGYAMLPLIRQEVLGHEWMSNAELINFLAVSESTPGSMSVNMATYIGLKTGNIPGLIAAVLGVSLPSFAIMLLIAIFYDRFIKNKAIAYVLEGLKPVVVGMIASAVISVGEEVFFPKGEDVVFGPLSSCVPFFIFLICLGMNHFKKGPIAIIGVSALLGVLAGVLLPH
ncbi:MAG: chromate transporter [Erysipelotrichaceae bacterium]|nr:chromate transporter [Erysipelotrichaceae bacterium]MBR3005875.1 chromate transporter [Erysipelotrichaceae bacterium]